MDASQLQDPLARDYRQSVESLVSVKTEVLESEFEAFLEPPFYHCLRSPRGLSVDLSLRSTEL